MSRLIIIAGATGAGKSYLIREISESRNDIQVIRKVSTRHSRKNEIGNLKADLKLESSVQEVLKCDYTYNYCNNKYGIRKKDIDDVLHSNRNPVLIVASFDTISLIKNDYKDALVFYVHTGLSGEDLRRHLEEERDDIELEERMRREVSVFNDYMRHTHERLVDYFLINRFNSDLMDAVNHILHVELIHGIDANYVFVIMSFDKIFDDLYKAMKNAAKLIEKNGVIIERVEESRGSYIITDKIESCIRKARLIICDVTVKSPNVYYELGFARALGKEVILTAKKNTELPFDIKAHDTKFYSSEVDLQDILTDELNYYFPSNN